MKIKLIIFFSLTMLFACSESKNQVIKWEYKAVQIDLSEYEFTPETAKEVGEKLMEQNQKLLNENGLQGWELVSVTNGGYVFKRPILD